MDTKRIPIGISNYKRLTEENYYFVDKTDFIRRIIEEGSLITMLPRPRRFGKTLNLSMLRYFFERTEGNVFRPLFNGRKIEQWKDFDRYQGKYPVITLTLKDCKADRFEDILDKIASEVQKEFERHDYLVDSPKVKDIYQPDFKALYTRSATQTQLENSLSLLSELLSAHWGIPPLVLLDEYDTPVHVAYDKGFYDKMIGFMRNFMSTVFKDNTDIFRGVITGILRVSKESLFSGLNNIAVDTILDEKMCTSFGFTQGETDRMLADYGLAAHSDEVKQWYNGYLFGGEVVYNPWSVLNYTDNKGKLVPYWVNTGSNTLLRHLVAEGPSQVRRDMEIFLKGGGLRSVINDKLAFPDLTKSTENVWSFMLFSGYLKASDYQLNQRNHMTYYLEVPNKEVQTAFENIISSWIEDSSFSNSRLEEMLRSLISGDIEGFESILNEFVLNTLSHYDTGGHDVEKVYQAFMLGMLLNLAPDYEVNSNREAGFGRYDILLRPRNTHKQGIIMELKVCNPLTNETSEQALDSALGQIEKKQYAAALQTAGITDILKIAVTFDGKRVWVKTGN